MLRGGWPLLPPSDLAARNDEATIGEHSLLGDGMRLVVPAGVDELRDNSLAAYVGLRMSDHCCRRLIPNQRSVASFRNRRCRPTV